MMQIMERTLTKSESELAALKARRRQLKEAVRAGSFQSRFLLERVRDQIDALESKIITQKENS